MKISWDDVFLKPVMEFLNVVAYSRDKQEEQNRQMKEWQKRN